jgi:hypothetical protein
MAKRAKTGAAAPPRERRAHARAELTHVQLKAKQRRLRDGFPGGLQLRVHRALSWLDRAEREPGDDDVRFILLWVGFNAAYAGDLDSGAVAGGERDSFKAFFDVLVDLDQGQRIYAAVWERFAQEFRLLLENRYVFAPFWAHHNGTPGHATWPQMLAAAREGAHKAIARRETARFLALVFDRLYVLRNQLVHGGATWNGAVNRDQVRDGAAVLGWLLPIFIDIMMDNPARDWGRPYYPVVE